MNSACNGESNPAASSPMPSRVFTCSMLLLLVLGWIDYITGDYSLIIFYLPLAGVVAWYLKRSYAFLFCVLSLLTRLVADEAGSSFKFSASYMHYKNYFTEFVLLLFVSLLVSILKRYFIQQRER